jgi:CRISPR-associated protein Csb2
MALPNHPRSMLQPNGQTLHFALSGTRPRSPRCVVPLTNAWRAALLAAFEVSRDRPGSFLFSGRCADGAPDKEHAHAFYLPEIDADGSITGLRIVSPLAQFSAEEMRVLRSVETVKWAGPSARVNLMLMDEQDTSLLQVASSWESVTPYVPPRGFHQDRPKLSPAQQLADELRRDLAWEAGLVEATCTPVGSVPVRNAPKRGSDATVPMMARIGYRVQFQTSSPICGPVLLGHSAHFGLGQFRPGPRTPGTRE